MPRARKDGAHEAWHEDGIATDRMIVATEQLAEAPPARGKGDVVFVCTGPVLASQAWQVERAALVLLPWLRDGIGPTVDRGRCFPDAYDADRTYVIGDTPHDISCGKVIGARTVAVATGPGYTLAELEACEPWLALEALPGAEEFLALLGLGASPRALS